MSKKSRNKAIEMWFVTGTFITVICVVFILFQKRCNESLAWIGPAVSIPQYRSADGAAKPNVYTKEDLTSLASLLRDTVGESYAKARPHGFRLTFKRLAEYRMETSLRELFDGGIAVELRAYNFEDNTVAKEYTREFDNADAFRNGAPALAAEITGELAALAK